MKAAWDDDAIQFPRLLAEISAVGLTLAQVSALADSMDLDCSDITDLFERAERRWARIKRGVGVAP